MTLNDSLTEDTQIFLPGGGEMGERIRAFNWATTSLGPPSAWSQSLQTTLSIVINSSFPMFLMWGKELTCFYNDAFRPSLGNEGKHPSALGKKGSEVWAEIWHIIGPMLSSVMEDGEPVYHENLLVPFNRNGGIEDTYWTFSYSPVYDETQRPAGVFVTCTETTSNLNNLQRIKQHKEELEFAIDATELGTWDYNPESGQISANLRMKQWFGIGENEDFQFSTALERIAVPDRSRVSDAIATALQFESGGKYSIEYTIIHPESGTKRIVRAKGRTSFDSQQKACRVNGTLQDITAEAEWQDSVEESEKRWRALANLVPSYTFTLTNDGRIDYVSEKWHEFTGIRPQDDLHQGFMSALHPEDAVEFDARVRSSIRKKQAIEQEIRWRRFDGKYRWMVFRIEPVELKKGTIDSWFGSAMDITEIRNTEAALQASEKGFETLIRQVPTGITVFSGSDFQVMMANEAYLQIVDRKESDFVGRPLFESLPETKVAIEGLLNQVMETGVPCHGFEFPVTLNRYGRRELSYFNFTYQPVKEFDGQVSGIVVVAHDVTGLVRAKQAVSESEKQFRNMVMQSPVAMAILRGENFTIEIANHTMLQHIWRRLDHEVIGKNLLDVFPELHTQKYASLLKEVYQNGETHREYEAEAHVQGDDGMRTFYLDFEYRPLFDTNENVSGVMVSVYDVTEKVESRRKIEEVANELEMFKFIADNVSDFIGISDLTGHPLYVNKSGLAKVGLASFRESNLIDFFFEEDKQMIRQSFLPQVSQNGTGEIEVRFRHFKTGAPIWMLYNVVLLRDTNQVPYGFATISKDISSQKQWLSELEQKVEERTAALREANRQLARSNEDLQQFAHVASHDLKEPVRKIKIFGGRLQDEFNEVLGDKGNRYLDKIIDSTERMYAMINGVLNYSSQATLNHDMKEVDLNNVISSVESDLEILIGEKKAVIVRSDLPVVSAIPELMHQLFYNLVNNSLKFSRVSENCVISISSVPYTIQEKQFHQVTLRDNGIGFDNRFAENIFATFTRLNSREKYEGTGLGLSLCKNIVERHGGYISARGERNVGAEFSVLLPAN